MSYTIIYGRQFLKTTRSIIPLVLLGDSNVTERINGREVRERHWGIFANHKTEFTPDGYMELMKSWCGSAYQEHFMQHGKWVDDKGLISWAKNGIKSALTIEQIKQQSPVQSLVCFLTVYKKGSFDCKRELWQYCDTTETFEAWLDNAYKRRHELETNHDVFIHIGYMGREPLYLAPQSEPQGQVLIGIGKTNYICSLNACSYSYCRDIKQALVFDNTSHAKHELERNGFSFNKQMRFLKASLKTVTKNFCILAKTETYPNGIYIRKLTNNRLHYTHSPLGAMRFATERQAIKYIAKLGDRFSGVHEYEVVHTENLE